MSLADFTQREQEIIRLLIQGKNNQEIAQTLFLTVGTVKNYISQIYSKAKHRTSKRRTALKRLGF